MAGIIWHLKAEFEDGTELPVVADQRDAAAWEMQEFGTSGTQLSAKPYLAARWMAWNAMRRQALTKLAWKAFSDQCVEVVIAGDPDEDEPATPDPGNPDRSAASSST